MGHLPSVESRIAFTGKSSNSEDGVPKLGRGAEEVRLRTAALSSAALLLVLGLPAAALETVTIRSGDVSVSCRTHDAEGIMLACINNPEPKGMRSQPKWARAARNHLQAMVSSSHAPIDLLETGKPVLLDALNTRQRNLKQWKRGSKPWKT